MTERHIPVLLREVLEALAPKDGEIVIDGTFGAGGYTSAILDAAACRVLAFDRDITAIRSAAPVLERYGSRLVLVNAPFGDMEEVARSALAPAGGAPLEGPIADGVVLDIGVSSMQLDEAERGFSFQADGPPPARFAVDAQELCGASGEVPIFRAGPSTSPVPLERSGPSSLSFSANRAVSAPCTQLAIGGAGDCATQCLCTDPERAWRTT